jgi:hypothetical protein
MESMGELGIRERMSILGLQALPHRYQETGQSVHPPIARNAWRAMR